MSMNLYSSWQNNFEWKPAWIIYQFDCFSCDYTPFFVFFNKNERKRGTSKFGKSVQFGGNFENKRNLFWRVKFEKSLKILKMDLSLTSLTFRDFVPESLRNDYLEGKCKEIGEFYIENCIFWSKSFRNKIQQGYSLCWSFYINVFQWLLG